jgi:hypothetical protein
MDALYSIRVGRVGRLFRVRLMRKIAEAGSVKFVNHESLWEPEIIHASDDKLRELKRGKSLSRRRFQPTDA